MYPTVLHITHPKAASQWVKHLLHQLAPPGIKVAPGDHIHRFYHRPLLPGGVYAALYVSYPNYRFVTRFETQWRHHAAFMPNQAHMYRRRYWPNYLWNALLFQVLRYPLRAFFVLRDLRDTLVSLYFSLKYSHPPLPLIERLQKKLQLLDMEEGMIYLMDTLIQQYALIQRSWMGRPDVLIVRFEEITTEPFLHWKRVLAHCGWRVDENTLRHTLQEASFEKLAKRPRGQEDIHSHYRKGIAGDWKNYFTPRVKEEFKKRFGQLLIETAYEDDLSW